MAEFTAFYHQNFIEYFIVGVKASPHLLTVVGLCPSICDGLMSISPWWLLVRPSMHSYFHHSVGEYPQILFQYSPCLSAFGKYPWLTTNWSRFHPCFHPLTPLFLPLSSWQIGIIFITRVLSSLGCYPGPPIPLLSAAQLRLSTICPSHLGLHRWLLHMPGNTWLRPQNRYRFQSFIWERERGESEEDKHFDFPPSGSLHTLGLFWAWHTSIQEVGGICEGSTGTAGWGPPTALEMLRGQVSTMPAYKECQWIICQSIALTLLGTGLIQSWYVECDDLFPGVWHQHPWTLCHPWYKIAWQLVVLWTLWRIYGHHSCTSPYWCTA